MSVKEGYLGVFLFLVVSPALILFAPGLPAYGLVGAMVLFYGGFMIHKPSRRCVPCGQIVKLGPLNYLKAITNNLHCPRCGAHIKNKHRT